MGTEALIDLVSSFMEMERADVEAIDKQVGGLFVPRFLQQRMTESLKGRDTFSREAFSQFLYPGLYADVDPTNERAHIVPGFPAINHSYPNSVTLSVTRTCTSSAPTVSAATSSRRSSPTTPRRPTRVSTGSRRTRTSRPSS